MSRFRSLLAFVVSLACAGPLSADFIEIRRDAAVKANADRTSATVADAVPGAKFALIDQEQRNGYYKIETADGGEGWIYRTFVRRYPGEISSAKPVSPRESDNGRLSAATAPSVRSAASLTAPEAAELADFNEACGTKWGIPAKKSDFGQTFYVDHQGYVLEYSASRKIPLWAAHHLTADQLTVSASGLSGRPAWQEEGQIPAALRVHDSDYPSGGKPYNRGHMVPNADFSTREGRDSTFFLSNAVPQQWQNNQQIWQTLENYVREWVVDRGEAYVITGSLLYDPADDPESPDFDSAESDGVVDYEHMGASRVTVPTHIFKIILAPASKGSDQWESLAVVLENRRYLKGPDKSFDDDLDHGLHSIDWIEKRSGLNFFPVVAEGTTAEHALEAPISSHIWGH